MPATDAETQARIEWLGAQLATLHPPVHATPARPCAECRDYFVPDETTTHNVCTDCRNEHREPGGDYC